VYAYTLQMTYEYGEQLWNNIDMGKRGGGRLGEKPDPVCPLLQQIFLCTQYYYANESEYLIL
jgi:hypothetical protein